MRYFFLVLTFLFLENQAVSAEKNKWDVIQELIRASDMMAHIDEEFGPFQYFHEDQHIEEDMRKEGLDEDHVKANLGILRDFHHDLEKAKGPITAKVISIIAEHLDQHLTLEEIQELLRFFKSTAMQKFKKISIEKMPEIMSVLQKEKIIYLQEPFEKMKKKLNDVKVKNAKISDEVRK
ncbi:MAG: DUF2059 domain-containing protein [Alphaproteobacteria bacterium]|nr:DUF2059 domain-containing protein [Alphaproteobacteria bacterium]